MGEIKSLGFNHVPRHASFWDQSSHQLLKFALETSKAKDAAFHIFHHIRWIIFWFHRLDLIVPIFLLKKNLQKKW